MSQFLTAVDIGNRALQHLGQRQMTAALGFREQSKNAAEVGFAYPKLREAELRRNVWRFAIKRAILRPVDAATMLLAPALWTVGTTYFMGSIVSDTDGNLWISRMQSNLGDQPGVASTWEPYFGALSVPLYDSGTAYYSGELVYTAAGDGTNRVFISRENGNADNPATAIAWSATETYNKDDVVTKSATAYMSRVDLNTGNDPTATIIAPWSASTTYASGAHATGSDGAVYVSAVNGNINNDPVLDNGTNWTNTGTLSLWKTGFVGGVGSNKWLQIGGAEFPAGVTLKPFDIIYPLGCGPATDSNTRNIFRLPCGFLRKAPRDPKAGSYSLLGAPSGLYYEDWQFESDYLVSSDSIIILRFIADITDARQMDAMFCEGLAARLAYETCETLTQSTDKQRGILQAYETFMTDARTVNAIETGSEEPPVDDWIACRD